MRDTKIVYFESDWCAKYWYVKACAEDMSSRQQHVITRAPPPSWHSSPRIPRAHAAAEGTLRTCAASGVGYSIVGPSHSNPRYLDRPPPTSNPPHFHRGTTFCVYSCFCDTEHAATHNAPVEEASMVFCLPRHECVELSMQALDSAYGSVYCD